ncbi:hypothetical protein ACFL6X_03290 [Candidatus Latescibacterota bacterium]
MANRRFEMHQYRQVIVRMRLGDTDRGIAEGGLMGRRKAAEVRTQAQSHGWLDLDQPVPDEETLAQVFSSSTNHSLTPSQVLPYKEEVERWRQDGIRGTAIHQALERKYGFTGSHSSVRRFLQSFDRQHPQVTTILDFEPGDTAQVDFGRGPEITDVHTGEIFSTWIFVMVLAWSRHMYAEMVRCGTRMAPVPGPLSAPQAGVACFVSAAAGDPIRVRRLHTQCARGPHPPHVCSLRSLLPGWSPELGHTHRPVH